MGTYKRETCPFSNTYEATFKFSIQVHIVNNSDFKTKYFLNKDIFVNFPYKLYFKHTFYYYH